MLDTETLTRIITTLNPWHTSGREKLPAVPPTERNLLASVYRRLSNGKPPGEFKHEVIVGPRRAGKSTLLKQLANKLCQDSGLDPTRITYLSLDEMHGKSIELNQIADFLVARSKASISDPMYLLIDEAAYAPDWSTSLKIFYDQPERYPLKVVATSSSALELNLAMIESGADRWKRRFLMPCQIAEQCRLAGVQVESELEGATLSEILESIPEGHATTQDNIKTLENFKIFGGMPGNKELYNLADPELQMLENYEDMRHVIDKVITKDAIKNNPKTDPERLAQLFDLLADNPCDLIEPGKLSSELGVKKPTLERYMQILEDSMIMFRLNNQKGDYKKRFFYDNTVPGAATFQNYASMRESFPGWRLENLAAAALNELPKHSVVGTRLFHIRKNQKEVDFSLLNNREEQPMLFEIATSANHSTEGLLYMRDKMFKGKATACLIAPNVAAKHSKNFKTIPFFEFLLAVERQKDYLLDNK